MESSDQYNFSIFSPRNLHGRKNRNVILTMLVIWAVAVFGFQFLLRALEKPTPEKTLTVFEAEWSAVAAGNDVDYSAVLNSLLMVKGKNTVSVADRQVLSDAISCVTLGMAPDTVVQAVAMALEELEQKHAEITTLKDQQYLEMKGIIRDLSSKLIMILEPYTGFGPTSLEGPILIASLKKDFPSSLTDPSLARLPEVMKLYLTHNQSVLTDAKFLGFPFHYFYTAVFLLVLFVILCIVYNRLIEWRLNKEGIVE